MATNKHAIIRYEALDRCFSNKGRKFFINDLIAYVSEAIKDYTGSEASISRRQIFKDMDFMRSEVEFRPAVEVLILAKIRVEVKMHLEESYRTYRQS